MDYLNQRGLPSEGPFKRHSTPICVTLNEPTKRRSKALTGPLAQAFAKNRVPILDFNQVRDYHEELSWRSIDKTDTTLKKELVDTMRLVGYLAAGMIIICLCMHFMLEQVVYISMLLAFAGVVCFFCRRKLRKKKTRDIPWEVHSYSWYSRKDFRIPREVLKLIRVISKMTAAELRIEKREKVCFLTATLEKERHYVAYWGGNEKFSLVKPPNLDIDDYEISKLFQN
jgi:hypothetical protein